MKCVKCGTDNNLKERTEKGGRCKNCNHPFAFDPKAGSRFTDIFFNNSIKAISSENTLFFTPKQLWYLLEKRLVSKNLSPGGCLFLIVFLGIWIPLFLGIGISASPMIILLGLMCFTIWGSTSNKYKLKTRKIFAGFLQVKGGLIVIGILVWFFIFSGATTTAFILFLLGSGLGIFLVYFGTRQLKIQYQIPQSFMFKPSEITQWLRRWVEINDDVKKILPPPTVGSGSTQISSEISAYSFDRVVVCDTAEIAQILIANNFHFEHNCAVLSIDGYPQNVFSTIMEMLRRNPDLKVYAFHSATPAGVSLLHQLRNNPNWFLGNNQIIYDLGLLPRHVFSSQNMWILKSDESARKAQQMPAAVKQILSGDELAWLEAGLYAELESFSPQKLLRVLSQGIAKTQAVANNYISGSESSSNFSNSSNNEIIFISINDDDSSSRSSGFFASDSFG